MNDNTKMAELEQQIKVQQETIADLINNFNVVSKGLYQTNSLLIALESLPADTKTDMFSSPQKNLNDLMRKTLEKTIKIVDQIV